MNGPIDSGRSGERESSDDSLNVPVSGVHEQTDRRPGGVSWLVSQAFALSLSLSVSLTVQVPV